MRITLLLAIALPTLGACASTPPPETPAQVIGCNMDAPVRVGMNRDKGVQLVFTVNEKGLPLAQTAQVAHRHSATDRELSEARTILASCKFEPALHGNEPVHSRVSMFIRLHSRTMD